MPPFVKSATLLLDIPALMFISGASASLTGKSNALTSIARLILHFAVFAFFYDALSLNFGFSNVVRVSTLNYPSFTAFPVLQGSYWFVPVFVAVSIFGGLAITWGLRCLVPLVLLGFLFHLARYFEDTAFQTLNSLSILGVPASSFVFFLSMYLLGFWCHSRLKTIQSHPKTILVIFGVVGAFCYCMYVRDGSAVFDLQRSKFPVAAPYAVASLPSVLVILKLWQEDRGHFILGHIGKNALPYYIGQGVGSSILLHAAPHVKATWWIKLPLMFVLNLVLTVIASELLRYVVCSARAWRLAGTGNARKTPGGVECRS